VTLDEFLAALRATPRSWAVYFGGIRRSRGAQASLCRDCPITAVARHLGYRHRWASEFMDASREIGLDLAVTFAVQGAADHPGDEHPTCAGRAALRARLLDACGLPPEAAPSTTTEDKP
jgi:hypothetical protein